MSQNVGRNDQQSLSDDEMAQLLTLLGKVDGNKPLGTPLFNAISPIVVQPAVEAVWLRVARFLPDVTAPTTCHHRVEVYLTQRSVNDTAYPGQRHCPGSIVRKGEEIDDTFARLAKKEFCTRLKQYQFVRNFNNPHEERGHFLSQIYLCEFDESERYQNGQWWTVDCLPENTILHHREIIIPAAVGIFKADHATELLS